jgi:uncharacterized protein YjbI with pentapeptide repeats
MQLKSEKVLRRAGGGLTALLVAAGAPLVGAPLASAETCTVVPGKPTVCRDMVITAITGKDLTKADFTGSTFHKLDLLGVKLDGAIMTGVVFQETRIKKASMKGARLNGAVLRMSALDATDITGTQLMPHQELGSDKLTMKLASGQTKVTSDMLALKTRLIESATFKGCHDTNNKSLQEFGVTPADHPASITCEVFATPTVNGKPVDHDYAPSTGHIWLTVLAS